MIVPSVHAQCPSEELLRRLLDDELDPEQAKFLEAHIERCGECQRSLEFLTTDRSFRPSGPPKPKLRFHPGDGFLQELRTARADGADEPPTAEMPVVAGYRLVRELGRGGMGVVYLARHEGLNRLVALKLVPAAAHGSLRARFRREAEAVARLQHPHIVRIHEIGETGGWPFLALEYVEGTNLDRLIRGVPQPPLAAAALVERLARAIEAAHRRGIIHRDLKPANILLQDFGSDHAAAPEKGVDVHQPQTTFEQNSLLSPKIADFGLAKLLDGEPDGATRSGQLLGTPSYVAPEQIAGPESSVTTAADIYSLGAILYELLTGRPPFQAAAALETLLQVLHRDPIPPSRLQPKIPRDLETICLTCLNKSPSRRYASAESLADDLRRFLEGKPVKARPLGLAGRTLKWVRRHPTTSSLIAACVLAVGAATLGMAWLWREAERRADLEAAAHKMARQQTANLAVDRYLTMCEQGETARGILGLAETAANMPAEDSQLGWAVGTNLDAWRYFLVPRRLELTHPDEVNTVAFTPDSQVLATACRDGRVRLWNPTNGDRIAQDLIHPAEIVAMAVRFDGKALTTACKDGVARTWEIPTGRLICTTMARLRPFTSIALSPGNHLAITGCEDGTAQVWDADTGAPHGPPLVHDKMVACVAFSRKGLHVLTGCADGTARLWDANTGAALGVAAKHRSPVRQIAFSPDGVCYATGSDTDLIGAAPPMPGTNRQRSLRHNYPALAMAYEPHGDYLAFSGGVSENACGLEVFWWSGAFAVSRSFAFEGKVRHIDVSPGARRVLAAGDHWRASLLLDPFEQTKTLRLEHGADVRAAAFSPDYKRIATASRAPNGLGGMVYIWETPPDPAGVLTLGQRSVSFLSATPEGKAMAAGAGAVREWNLNRGEPSGPAWKYEGDCIAWGGGDIVWLGDGRRVTACALQSGQPTDLTIDLPAPIRSLVADSTGKIVVAADARPAIVRYDASSGRPLGGPFADANGAQLLAISPDGATVAAGGPDGMARTWHLESGQPFGAPFIHPSPVRAISFSPRSERLAVGCLDKTIQLWDLRKGQSAAAPIVLSEVVAQIAWHPEGRLLATACIDGTARFWDAETSKPIGPPILWKASSLAFSPDGKFLLVGSRENDVRSWKTPEPLAIPAAELPVWAREATGTTNR